MFLRIAKTTHSRGKATSTAKPNTNPAKNVGSVPSIRSWFGSFFPGEAPALQPGPLCWSELFKIPTSTCSTRGTFGAVHVPIHFVPFDGSAHSLLVVALGGSVYFGFPPPWPWPPAPGSCTQTGAFGANLAG